MALSPSGTAHAFNLPWSYKWSGMTEEANTRFVQQIQEFRALSEALFALGAKALFALVPLPWAPGDRLPKDEQHQHNSVVSAQNQSDPSNSKQPSILVGLFGTEWTESALQVKPSETFKSQCSTWMSAYLFLLFKHYAAELNGGLLTPA